ncbi:MAG: hypothetical protein K2H68_03050 [Bacteroidales bacterium]|nr:hypothetical protein [Bacteroidales bacterium]
MEEKKIELHSPAVQEIFGKPPRWIFSWGISLIVIVLTVFALVFFCWKVPERIPVQVVSMDLQEGWVIISAQDANRVQTSTSLYGNVNKGDTIYWYRGKISNWKFIESPIDCYKISFSKTGSGLSSTISSDLENLEESFSNNDVYFFVREKTMYRLYMHW